MNRLHDLETTAKIKIALIANPHVGGLDIGVDTINDIVFLKGFVQDSDQKLLAEEIVRSHGGIDVKNDIEVLSDASLGKGEAAEFVADNHDIAIEDEAILQRLLSNLTADSRINALMINVETADGIVKLSGVQDSQAGSIRAEEIARQVQGVKDVINNIRVRS